jgi:hypothetical protein
VAYPRETPGSRPQPDADALPARCEALAQSGLFELSEFRRLRAGIQAGGFFF